MKAPFFHGETDLQIDLKHRLILPAEARKAIMPEHGEELFVVVGSNRVPWMYPDKYYEFLVSQTMPEVIPDEASIAFNQLKYAMAYRVKWDAQGRMVLPEKLLKLTGLKTEVTLLGCRDHLQLWDRSRWEGRREELWQTGIEVERKAREANRRRQLEITKDVEPRPV